MRDVLSELSAWWRAGKAVGVATVVDTWSSAPRQHGATMLVGPDGTVAGSVSGGCVESAVYELTTTVRDDPARPAVRQRYGVSDDDAFAVGLTCGGVIDVFVERIDPWTFPELGAVIDDIDAGRPVAVATVVGDDTGDDRDGETGDAVGRRLVMRGTDATAGTLGRPGLDAAVRDDARQLLRDGRAATLHYGADGERDGIAGIDVAVFIASFAPPPRMIVFGAIDFAAAVARQGAFLGYRVTVCDARPTFATPARFPAADEVVVSWPHRYLADAVAAGEVDDRSVVCVLTHDTKFDVPLLEVALSTPLAYVGAMGSRRTHAERVDLLRDRGLGDGELARLHSPIGLDLGACTPEETAVAVAAEIVAHRRGGTGRRLRDTSGRIHRPVRTADDRPHVTGSTT